MKTIVIDVLRAGCKVELKLRDGEKSGQVILVLTDQVEIVSTQPSAISKQLIPEQSEYGISNDFPPRKLTEEAILQILSEHGGSVRIRDDNWNIYDEIAARTGVSITARRRLTKGTGEAAWRPEVGYCRKNLEQAGRLEPTDVSGRGIWTLKN
jgi:hypothetical protein